MVNSKFVNGAIVDYSKNENISKFISQAYLVHQTGLVSLSRRYRTGCISSDPQLVGGFISAIATFSKNSKKNDELKCEGNSSGDHLLTDIGTSCSRWFIFSKDEHHTALLIPNQSILNKEFAFLRRVALQIIESFALFKEFNIETEESIIPENSLETEEFGDTVDNILADALKDFTGKSIKIDMAGELLSYEAVY